MELQELPNSSDSGAHAFWLWWLGFQHIRYFSRKRNGTPVVTLKIILAVDPDNRYNCRPLKQFLQLIAKKMWNEDATAKCPTYIYFNWIIVFWTFGALRSLFPKRYVNLCFCYYLLTWTDCLLSTHVRLSMGEKNKTA